MPTKQELLDLQFIEVRHKLIEVAAFLDRIDRHPGAADFRYAALQAAIPILLSARPDRTSGVLQALSDHSHETIPKAVIQGALGAARPAEDSDLGKAG
ncbi:MAG: hypothetical protein DVB25_02100 [Verrucomicrobia bacterium]|nr:MAG: hypothetical protein DVB25_02100 [Verrucomicrobiota bacterium]